MNLPTSFTFELPDWITGFVDDSPEVFATHEDRVRFAIALAKHNVEHQTGGPFGAAVFDQAGRLIAPGVNLVPTRKCSNLHAEIVAIAFAQQVAQRYDLGDGGQHDYELVSSTEPCAMCYGAVPWSGVKRLICGNRDADARAIGFDEGAKLDTWVEALEERGIAVVRDVLRDEANAVFELYQRSGGTIY